MHASPPASLLAFPSTPITSPTSSGMSWSSMHGTSSASTSGTPSSPMSSTSSLPASAPASSLSTSRTSSLSTSTSSASSSSTSSHFPALDFPMSPQEADALQEHQLSLSQHQLVAARAERALEKASTWKVTIQPLLEPDRDRPGPRISSPTIKAAAKALLSVIKALYGSTSEDPLPPGTTVHNATKQNLMCSKWDVTVDIGAATGPGPFRAVFAELIRIMVEDLGHWVITADGYFTPSITSIPLSPEDAIAYEAYGAIIRQGLCWDQPLLRISPFLLVLLLGSFTQAVSQELVEALAPYAAERLGTWPPPTRADGTLSLDAGVDPMLLLNEVEESLTIHRARQLTASEQASLTPRCKSVALFATGLVGLPGTPPAIEAMRRGLRWTFASGVTFGQTFDRDLLLIAQGLFQGRRLTHYAQLIPLLQYQVGENTPPDSSFDFAASVQKWKDHFERFIQVAKDPFDPEKQVQDDAYRARLLMKSVAEWEYLPINPRDRIKIKFVHQLSAGENDRWAPLSGLVIHTCSHTLEVLVDPDIAPIFSGPPDLENMADPSAFDQYLFQVLTPGTGDQAYTML
ncbi:hypothetical protein FA95DRAFT_771681 [Auriscalpium vulgare]|uniref:Uncharacterized protein n=1 Tax=Auriscalpium vulgare TaxID=40419 RepID=A0ACB8RAH6_9AGAM|nr:hypothetical protein FA95DRAFT_771681 [Auriscalpium vulgare]